MISLLIFLAGSLSVTAINIYLNVLLIKRVKHKFEVTQSADAAMAYYKKLGYLQLIVLTVGAVVASLSIFPLAKEYEFVRKIGFIYPLIYLATVYIISQTFTYPVIVKIRNLTISRTKFLGESVRNMLFLYVPIAIFSIIRQINTSFLTENAQMILFAVICIAFLFCSPYILRWQLKAKPLNNDVSLSIKQTINEFGLKRVNIYEWKTKDTLVANALVTGVFREKHIYLSDYLLEKLSVDEIKSVLLHEVGHIKHWHLVLRIAIIAASLGVMFIVFSLLDYFGVNEFNYVFVLSIVGVLALVFLLILLNLKFIRMTEYHADKYVIKAGIKKDVFIDALTKLYHLNHQAHSEKSWVHKLDTHPTLDKRIEAIKSY